MNDAPGRRRLLREIETRDSLRFYEDKPAKLHIGTVLEIGLTGQVTLELQGRELSQVMLHGATTVGANIPVFYAGNLAIAIGTDEGGGGGGGSYLSLSGGTMTGPIVLPGNPTLPLQAAPKQYVDAAVAAVAVAPIQPDALSGLVCWLKADTLGLADNAAVASWADSSGNGKTFTQATGANQPIYKTAQLNGLGVVRFDASNDGMGSALVINSGTYTIIALWRYNSPTASAQRRVVNGSNNWLMGPYNARYAFHNGNFAAMGPGAGIHFRMQTAMLDNRGFHYVDGDFCGASDAQGYPNTLYLGAGSAGVGIGEPADSDIAEVIFYSRALTWKERAGVEAYLRAKWNL